MKQIKLFYSSLTSHFEDDINKFLVELQEEGSRVLGFKQTESEGDLSVMVIYEDTVNFNDTSSSMIGQ